MTGTHSLKSALKPSPSLRAHDAPACPAIATTLRPTKEKFIRAKYADREFVVKENLDPHALGRVRYGHSKRFRADSLPYHD
jgi:hypothetical protein